MISRAGKGSLSIMALSCSQAKTWVNLHYERNEEGVVAKSVMYKHYEEFCKEHGRNIMETSIFGRVVKSVFPDVTIRRLGGRDNLKYYYCGIRAKETSPYAIDNSTTTRPKRRLRKRELVTDKTEVHNCLRWLHAHYAASNDASVVKTDVYEGYLTYCKPRGVEPLSIQYFGMVVTHAFPNVTKRKLGPRTNQQKYYFGIQERPNPMSLDLVPSEYLSTILDVLGSSKPSYRENPDNVDEEEEDFNCRSPESDMSDIVSQTVGYEPETRTSPHLQHYSFDQYIKGDSEPVDYSLSSLRLKDEPPEDEDLMLTIKEEPLDLHITSDVCSRRTPDRPPSVSAFGGSNSPSPPTKEMRSKRIYKPRFHYYDESSSWNEDSADVKREETEVRLLSDSLESQSASSLKNWILHHFEISKGVHVNRDQVYEFYEKYCDTLSLTVLPMTFFDETMLKVFRGVVTMIHPSGKTFYEGIRVSENSSLFSTIEEYCQDDSQWVEDVSQNVMELSPGESTSHSSPLNFDYEEEPPGEVYPFHCTQGDPDDIQSTPEVLKDGKFYLKQWLTNNFESFPESCVLKADAYRHYDDYARSINQTPFEMNVFGKIVRQVFPKVTIRRLGGRLKPQYHYCGIAVKSSSPLLNYMSGKDPAQRSRKKEIATDNKSAEIVIDFLQKNYEPGKERIIMKSEVFDNYISFSNSLNENPVTLNYFGKLVKHCFPNVEVRKFGGRSEPTWYYFGLVPRCNSTSYKHPSMGSHMTPTVYQEDPSTKDTLGSSHPDLQAPLLNSRGLSPYGLESGHQIRHSTSPIPISIGRTHLQQPTGHYNGSPSMLHNHLQAALRVSSYDEPNQGSPADSVQFYRDAISSHSPAEVYFSRSPVENTSQGQLFHPSHLEGIYSREMHHQHAHRLAPHIGGGGQVVPSQTPPSLCVGTQGSIDQSINMQAHKKVKRPFAIQEEYEIFNDIGME